ncbi:hypothetical protein OHD62_14225 [Mesorhizobium sp. YC-39]|uniref:hypothetical protein n=1 Tax=unclassified Mesorhizobium TaxID=325217 RepID=UPI0021E71D6E|nr:MULTISPECIES: hypothetical protein [unclassified Mesorhizobium]MCV3207796.1 hypothetical protein [Mesorhizobium sp. YC-2]MCV3229523.1 hypothetical protein [Mesorhizobium sp. YC-39]
MPNQALRQSEIENLQCIATMTMAEASRFPMIAYLLGMAYAEAFDVLRGGRPVRLIAGTPRRSAFQPKAVRTQSVGA